MFSALLFIFIILGTTPAACLPLMNENVYKKIKFRFYDSPIDTNKFPAMVV